MLAADKAKLVFEAPAINDIHQLPTCAAYKLKEVCRYIYVGKIGFRACIDFLVIRKGGGVNLPR